MNVHKKKLNIDEQIEDMKSKGITFDIVNEEAAANFLKYRNYYFKIKAYARDYETYRTTAKAGQYIKRSGYIAKL